MACTCYDDIESKLKERTLSVHESHLHKLLECRFTNTYYVLAAGDHSRIAAPVTVRYVRRKKDGSPEKRATNEDTFVTFKYCPFCGTKFDGKPEA